MPKALAISRLPVLPLCESLSHSSSASRLGNRSAPVMSCGFFAMRAYGKGRGQKKGRLIADQGRNFFRSLGNEGEIGAGGGIGSRTALFPIPIGAERNAIAARERNLGELGAPPDLPDQHAIELRLGLHRGGGGLGRGREVRLSL